jgi:hypothetical protein
MGTGYQLHSTVYVATAGYRIPVPQSGSSRIQDHCSTVWQQMDRENQLNCIAGAGKRHQNLSASLVTPFNAQISLLKQF